MKWENPIFFFSAQSNIAQQYAPDWEIKATFPFSGYPSAKLAFKFVKVEICPKQFGPNKFILFFRHFSLISFSNLLFPISEKPAAIILIFLVPLAMQSSTTLEQNLAATTTMTKSRGSFISLTLKKDGWLYKSFPPTLVLTAYNFPSNLALITLLKINEPNFFGSSLTPTTAMLLGLKKFSSI